MSVSHDSMGTTGVQAESEELNQNHECEMCKTGLELLQEMEGYLENFSELSLCQCEVCGVSFPDEKSLSTHQHVHYMKIKKYKGNSVNFLEKFVNRPNLFTCVFCCKTFVLERNLYKHYMSAHEGMMPQHMDINISPMPLSNPKLVEENKESSMLNGNQHGNKKENFDGSDTSSNVSSLDKKEENESTKILSEEPSLHSTINAEDDCIRLKISKCPPTTVDVNTASQLVIRAGEKRSSAEGNKNGSVEFVAKKQRQRKNKASFPWSDTSPLVKKKKINSDSIPTDELHFSPAAISTDNKSTDSTQKNLNTSSNDVTRRHHTAEVVKLPVTQPMNSAILEDSSKLHHSTAKAVDHYLLADTCALSESFVTTYTGVDGSINCANQVMIDSVCITKVKGNCSMLNQCGKEITKPVINVIYSANPLPNQDAKTIGNHNAEPISGIHLDKVAVNMQAKKKIVIHTNPQSNSGTAETKAYQGQVNRLKASDVSVNSECKLQPVGILANLLNRPLNAVRNVSTPPSVPVTMSKNFNSGLHRKDNLMDKQSAPPHVNAAKGHLPSFTIIISQGVALSTDPAKKATILPQAAAQSMTSKPQLKQIAKTSRYFMTYKEVKSTLAESTKLIPVISQTRQGEYDSSQVNLKTPAQGRSSVSTKAQSSEISSSSDTVKNVESKRK